MDTSPARVRAVITGLLLAIVSASSLVAFSLLAGSADNPRTVPVVPHSASAAAAPVVLGNRVENEPSRARVDTTEGGRPTLTFQVAVAEDEDEARVLGTRIRNNENQKPDKNPSVSDETPDTMFGPESEYVECRCAAKPKNDAANGNAYGHDKNKAQGNAYGHDKTPPGHAKGSKN